MPLKLKWQTQGPRSKKKFKANSKNKNKVVNNTDSVYFVAWPKEKPTETAAASTPPAIQGPEVSASWRRTSRGEVLMTVRMPQDMVDSEVYVKTPRGHSAVNLDPWTSSTWRKPWNKYHIPNKVTKDKGISLNKTARRQG